MSHEAQFKRGQRVRYIGSLVPPNNGREGTITSIGKAGRIWVRFSGDGYSLQCFPCNLERIGRTRHAGT